MIAIDGFPSRNGPLDIRMQPGEVVLLRGANGAGKTSILRAIAGLEAPLAPRAVRVDGARAMCAQDPRDALVGLTVAGEFRLRGQPLAPAVARLAARESATLSSGESRRLGLAAVSQTRAPILLLDEPTEGLDAHGRDALRALVTRARDAGGMVVAADHAGLLDGLATRTIDLTPRSEAALPPMPRAEGDAIIRSPAARARGCDLPAVELGPGFHTLRGPNGAGKSTLLLRLAGIAHASGVSIAGAPPTPGRNVRLALPHASDLFTRDTVHDELAAADAETVERLVPRERLARHPFSLSGGEAQRVALARCLGQRAAVYLLDEPEAHLAADGRAALVACIAQRVHEGACVLAATHDESLHARAQQVVDVGARQ